jgi:hypothetical protein
MPSPDNRIMHLTMIDWDILSLSAHYTPRRPKKLKKANALSPEEKKHTYIYIYIRIRASTEQE